MDPDVRAALAAHLAVFDRNRLLVARSVAGIDEAASRRPLIDGGTDLHWLLAHLVASRDGLLARLGAERVWDADQARAFQRGSPPGASSGATVADQVARLDLQQERLAAALAGIDDDTLGRPAGPMTVAAWIEFMAWHETYHLGQVTLYRRAAGLESVVG